MTRRAYTGQTEDFSHEVALPKNVFQQCSGDCIMTEKSEENAGNADFSKTETFLANEDEDPNLKVLILILKPWKDESLYLPRTYKFGLAYSC